MGFFAVRSELNKKIFKYNNDKERKLLIVTFKGQSYRMFQDEELAQAFRWTGIDRIASYTELEQIIKEKEERDKAAKELVAKNADISEGIPKENISKVEKEEGIKKETIFSSKASEPLNKAPEQKAEQKVEKTEKKESPIAAVNEEEKTTSLPPTTASAKPAKEKVVVEQKGDTPERIVHHPFFDILKRYENLGFDFIHIKLTDGTVFGVSINTFYYLRKSIVQVKDKVLCFPACPYSFDSLKDGLDEMTKEELKDFLTVWNTDLVEKSKKSVYRIFGNTIFLNSVFNLKQSIEYNTYDSTKQPWLVIHKLDEEEYFSFNYEQIVSIRPCSFIKDLKVTDSSWIDIIEKRV